MGESRSCEAQEVAAVNYALEIGYRLIDTAEMYAGGGAERIVGRAIQNLGAARRRELTIVSKVLPSNAGYKKTIAACQSSIDRMGCDYLDIFLLHWQGSYPFEETLRAFLELQSQGLIQSWGVSNLDVAEFKIWQDCEKKLGVAGQCATNQVYYALSARGVEFDLLPFMQERKIPLMAYSPLGTGDLVKHAGLNKLAQCFGISAAQLSLAWLMHQKGVVAIPKSSDIKRLKENFIAQEIHLSRALLEQVDGLFPPPKRKQPLAVI